MMNLGEETKLAIQAAQAAGKKILSIYNSDFTSQRKMDGSEITEADRASQSIITEFLIRSRLPILSEEQDDDLFRLKENRIWIVDPLDGTTDFIARTGEFSVMIAVVENQTPILGVIYQPANEALFVAEKGKGAYIVEGNNWKKLQVRKTTDLNKVRAVMSRHHMSLEEKNFLGKLGITDVIKMGSAGLKALAIAQGQADLYFTFTDKIKQWDTAAAYSLVTEAGGRITDLEGLDLVYNTENLNHDNGIIMSNGYVHKNVVEIYLGVQS